MVVMSGETGKLKVNFEKLFFLKGSLLSNISQRVIGHWGRLRAKFVVPFLERERYHFTETRFVDSIINLLIHNRRGIACGSRRAVVAQPETLPEGLQIPGRPTFSLFYEEPRGRGNQYETFLLGTPWCQSLCNIVSGEIIGLIIGLLRLKGASLMQSAGLHQCTFNLHTSQRLKVSSLSFIVISEQFYHQDDRI